MPSDRDLLRQTGQVNLGVWIEAATGNELWSIQHEILTAVSQPRSRVAVPSCNASGKTFLAARAALAFYDAYTPGTPCAACDPTGTKGGCRGGKVLCTSSKDTHLEDNLFGEIRMAVAQMANLGYDMPGELPPKDTFLMDNPGNHFIRGQVATKEEGFQGYHAAHKLIIGDEATAVSPGVANGITSLLATGDSRLLLIFNPTTNDTYAAQQTRSKRVTTIPITAFDTPNFTNEHAPEGSNLITPEFLEDLKAQGDGPGSYIWTTRILAEFWDRGDDVLIPQMWVDAAKERQSSFAEQVAVGIDLAPYGSAESAIAVRRGDTLVHIGGHAAQRTDFFIMGDPTDHSRPDNSPVKQAIANYGPSILIYDADGVGAGAIGDFMRVHAWAIEHGHMKRGSQVIGFRGGVKVADAYLNARTGWWWMLRKRFERGGIMMKVADAKLEGQLSQMTYRYTPSGVIRVETKDEMKSRGLNSPDRADAVMYAFAFSEELAIPEAANASDFVVTAGYVDDHSEEAEWERMMRRGKKGKEVNAVTGLPDEL